MTAVSLPIPDSVDALTDAWLTDALVGVSGGATVTGHSRAPVGTGQVADTYRFSLVWDRENPAPSTLIVKVTAGDDTSRGAAKATRTYEIEASFYNDLAAHLPVRAPRCYHAAHDPAGDGYVVVLEDLAPAQQGDQLTGCSTDEAALAIEELPKLHAPRWDDPGLASFAWLDRTTPESIEGTAFLVNMMTPGFVERYAPSLSPDIVALVERFMPRLQEYLSAGSRPWTVSHGDFRLDNLLFGDGRVAVVDWQTVAHGPGISDLAYFIGSASEPELRRAHERELVDHYTAGMAAHGVPLDNEWVWNQYRRYSFGGLIMAVVASMLVGRTDRGDQMFIAMAERHGRQVLDLDAESLIAGAD